MAKKISNLVDPMATRDLWVAIADGNIGRVKKAVLCGANVNDVKRPNPWSASDMPFLTACKFGDVEMVKYLHKAGASRRSSGKNSRSGLGVAVHHQQSQIVSAILEIMKPTHLEMVEAYRAIDEGPSMSNDKSDRWVDFLTNKFEEKGVKFDDKTAYAVLMLWLGGEGSQMPLYPERAERVLSSSLMGENPLSGIEDAPRFFEWGVEIARRNWIESSEALDMLHRFGFPFDRFAQRITEGHQIAQITPEQEEWVNIQASIQAQRMMNDATPQVSQARPGSRL